MASNLVIVESPAKARSIQKYLGSGFQVIASMGHVMDLPAKDGLAITKSGRSYRFEPRFEPLKKKDKAIREIKAAAKKASAVFLATDPDREGEVIAYHLAELLRQARGNFRVLFHEITPSAVKEAFSAPREIDMKLVESQQARRILDRIVGFDVSQLLWDKVARGLSAGRVQSVALRLIVEREREIRRFVPVESWSIRARLEKDGQEFEAVLAEIEGKKADLPDEGAAKKVLAGLKGRTLTVADVTRGERRRHPAPPFITSTLQQEASRRLGLPVAVTMRIAQTLYEGVDLGEEGPTGLITYMRTDSVRVADSAIEEARQYIGKKIGKAYLPDKPNRYKTSKAAQDAHEAIRPTSVLRTPAQMAKYLDAKTLKIYKLVWSRFVASQCEPAVYDSVVALLESGPYRFKATGSTVKFQGFLKVYADALTEERSTEEEESAVQGLPSLDRGDTPRLLGFLPRQHFTQPPPRYSEAALVKALEEKGIGRPSTYASIIATLKSRTYTHIEKKRLVPTDLGMSVTDLLVEAFPDVFNLGFTAEMEKELDEVEEGTIEWQKVLNNFYVEFLKDMATADQHMPNLKAGVPTKYTCPACSAPMNLRYGRMGRFLACSSYPDCSSTFEVTEDKDGNLVKVERPKFDTPCPKCGGEMLFKRSRFGAFLACARYPECRGSVPLVKTGENAYEPEPVIEVKRPCPTCGGKMEVKRSLFGRFFACERYPDCKGSLPFFIDVPCPREGCSGELRERQSKKGPYYTCSAYPECKFRANALPVRHDCPACSAPSMLTDKNGGLKCARPGCEGRIAPADDSEPDAD